MSTVYDKIIKENKQFRDHLIESESFNINYEEDNYDAGKRDGIYETTPLAFFEGAMFILKNLWHDYSKVKPEKYKKILAEFPSDTYVVGFVGDDKFKFPNGIDNQFISYECVRRKAGDIIRYIYLEDLI